MSADAGQITGARPPLRIYICGRLAIETGDCILLERDFPARQGRLMWTFLVLERRRPVGREDLAYAIWGDDIPDGWAATLNAVASRLRSMLKPVSDRVSGFTLRGDSGRYELVLPAGSFVDFERARYGLHVAEAALSSGDLQSAVSEARVALEIAARGILDGEYAPWIEANRRLLLSVRIHAIECTAEAELRRGNPRFAEREAEQLIALDPLDEAGYRLRMRAAAALGNRSGLVRTMRQCRQALRDEAGMVPSPETERLFEDLSRR